MDDIPHREETKQKQSLLTKETNLEENSEHLLGQLRNLGNNLAPERDLLTIIGHLKLWSSLERFLPLLVENCCRITTGFETLLQSEDRKVRCETIQSMLEILRSDSFGLALALSGVGMQQLLLPFFAKPLSSLELDEELDAALNGETLSATQFASLS